MRSFFTVLLLVLIPTAFIHASDYSGLDPDSVDPEMTQVMYKIAPSDIKTAAYKNGIPSRFNIKLCKSCKINQYSFPDNSEVLLHGQPLNIKHLTIHLIKKKFNVIQLGINRNNKSVSYLYLGGISESNAEELIQEQSDEH